MIRGWMIHHGSCSGGGGDWIHICLKKKNDCIVLYIRNNDSYRIGIVGTFVRVFYFGKIKAY